MRGGSDVWFKARLTDAAPFTNDGNALVLDTGRRFVFEYVFQDAIPFGRGDLQIKAMESDM